MRTSLRTVETDSINRQSSSLISLRQVRSGPRTSNQYVDTPHEQLSVEIKPNVSQFKAQNNHQYPGFVQRVCIPTTESGCELTNSRSSSSSMGYTSNAVISQQPLTKSQQIHLKNNILAVQDTSMSGDNFSHENLASTGVTEHPRSLICKKCGKCQCAPCTEPKGLPSHWCCWNKFEISPTNLLNFVSCFCCIKGIFYHISTDDENEDYESPCGCCGTPNCCRRWSIITTMSLCLPCLWCYWPLRGTLDLCKVCYNRCRQKGCQCKLVLRDKESGFSNSDGVVIGSHSKHSQTQRLLIESDGSSA